MSEILDKLKESAKQRELNQEQQNHRDTKSKGYWWINGVSKTPHKVNSKVFQWKSILLALNLFWLVVVAVLLWNISQNYQELSDKISPEEQKKLTPLPELVVHETNADFKKLKEPNIALSLATEDGKLIFEERVPLAKIVNDTLATVELDKTEGNQIHINGNKIIEDQTTQKELPLQTKEQKLSLENQIKKEETDILSQSPVKQKVVDHMLSQRAKEPHKNTKTDPLADSTTLSAQSPPIQQKKEDKKTTPAEPKPTKNAASKSAQPVTYDWTKLPTYYDLPESTLIRLPFLDFSAHLYAPDPQARMIILNKLTLKEGDKINDKFYLKQITPEGVVFLFEDTPFYLKVWE